MIKINIVAVGSIKDNNILELISEYIKRMRIFCDLKIIEVKPESFSEKDREIAKEKEWQKIKEVLKNIKADNYFLLAEDGRQYDTQKFAEKTVKDKSSVVFIIGGALGWTKSARLDKMIMPLSLSQLTFPHEMARLALIEQIYRSLMILNNKTYHY